MGFSLTSFVMETVNFIVLLWLLSRLVYKPIKKSLDDRRRTEEERVRVAAKEMQSIEEQRRALLERERDLSELRDRAVREANEEAAEVRARLLTEAREDAAADRARGQKLLETERRAAETILREATIEESTRIAARLLGELAPTMVDDALLERLVQSVRTHAGALRREIDKGAPEIDVRFARQPKEGALDRLEDVFAETFGERPKLRASEDPKLVAGLVATVGHQVLDASIAGNLAVLVDRARELSEGDIMSRGGRGQRALAPRPAEARHG